MGKLEQPQGVPFFSVKTGETRHAKMEPQIQAYINSSDMGINASRGQDFGWRLGADWVKKLKAFRNDANKMSILAARTDGRKVTEVQMLYFLYGEELRAFRDQQEEEANPFEDQYQSDISTKPKAKPAPEAPKTETPKEEPKTDPKPTPKK